MTIFYNGSAVVEMYLDPIALPNVKYKELDSVVLLTGSTSEVEEMVSVSS
jgi:hypothetical protein